MALSLHSIINIYINTYISKDLYVGSFYRLPDNHDPEYLMRLQSYITRIPIHTYGLVVILTWPTLTGGMKVSSPILPLMHSVNSY